MGSRLEAKVHVLKHEREWVTSPYGKRTDPITGAVLSQHNGIDLIDETNGTDNIIAVADGVVEAVQTCVKGIDTQVYTAGNYVKIKHDEIHSTRYLHMKYGSISLKVGDKVKKGQIIGFMGTTGYSTGNHLHFEVWKNGTRVDPTPYLKGTETFGKNDNDNHDDNDNDDSDLRKGDKVTLKNAPLYGASTSTKKANTISGTYWIHSDGIINKRIRITTPKGNTDCTGWVNVADCKTKALAIGDKVTVKVGATFSDGTVPFDYVYNTTYDVQNISRNGKEALIGLRGEATGWMFIKDLVMA